MCRFHFLRASCRIRTNDPEITNHVLWPTELKRRVGMRSASRRYDQVPLLRSSPGGFRGSWPYRTFPCSCRLPAFAAFVLSRRERDSNSRTAFDGHTLSRRASSATRASLRAGFPWFAGAKVMLFSELTKLSARKMSESVHFLIAGGAYFSFE